MFTPKALNTSRSRLGSNPRVSALKSNRNDSFGSPSFSTTPIRSAPLHTPQSATTTSFTAPHTSSNTTGGGSLHQLDSYGGLLPVLVTELVSYSDKNSKASVHLGEHGWATLVMGKKLLVWKFKVSSAFTKTPQCVELSLPAATSEVRMTSASVVLLPSDAGEDSPPACLAVSPGGVVRHWESTGHLGAFTEATIDIREEHFVSVVALEQKDGTQHYVAAGNNSTLYLITPSSSGIKWRPFQKPHGMLKGISRRMSSFIFGGMPTAESLGGGEMKALITGEIMEETEARSIYLLSSSQLQKWCVVGETEKMLYQQNVERLIGESMAQDVWKQEMTDLPNLKLWLLDMQSVGDAVIVLGAGYNPDVSNQVYFCIGTLHTEGCDPPQSFLSYSIPQFNTQYNDLENSWLKTRLILPDSNKWNVYLYDNQSVVCTSVTSSQQPIDKVDFISPGDKLLGGGICDKSALFFSNVHGVVTIKELGPAAGGGAGGDQSTMMDTNQSIMSPEQSYMDNVEELSCSVSEDKIMEMSMSDDSLQRLKAAFLHYVRGHNIEAQNLIEDLFSGGSRKLDSLVLSLSQEMVNDIPARDPRWAEQAVNSTSLGSGSLILMHQLDDKLKAHEYFIKFLKTMDLWEKLTTIMSGHTSPQPTRFLLCEHAEKIVAAKSLRESHVLHELLVNSAIEKVMLNRGGEDMSMINVGGLTAHDLFYRKVSRVEDVFEQLIVYEEICLSHSKASPKDVYNLISAVNNTLYNAMFAAYQYRITKSVLYECQDTVTVTDYIPWTSTPGPNGLREVMKKQHYISVHQGISEAGDIQEKENLFQQIMEMADMVLDGYKLQLEALKVSPTDSEQTQTDAIKIYQEQRTNLIAPFLKHDQYERAASLAEKYCDFGILVEICEQTRNEERLQRYMDQFHNKGFPDFVFRWYIEEGKRGKLMASTLVSHPQMAHFLQGSNNKFMSWLNDINASDFHRAHYTLLELAQQEEK